VDLAPIRVGELPRLKFGSSDSLEPVLGLSMGERDQGSWHCMQVWDSLDTHMHMLDMGRLNHCNIQRMKHNILVPAVW
jgi:hypothetical protein